MKNSLKDKLQDGELDLSMMQYSDVPIKELELLGGKVTTLNLSHNLLSYLPSTFPLLSHLVKLDLSKNLLSELPDNFGQLRGLKWLDLYGNKLTRLPVSFAQLKNLKWLDLKDNLLVPAIQQAAGPCITPNDCAMCAKKVVALLQSMESQLQRERQRKMEMEQEAFEEKARMEELERERIRQEKRAAKDRRREELKLKEERRREEENKLRNGIEFNSNGSVDEPSVKEFSNGHAGNLLTDTVPSSGSLCYSLLMFLMGFLAVGVALTVSLVWIYSEGNLDSNSVHAALSNIGTDVEDIIADINRNAYVAWDAAAKISQPYIDSVVKSASTNWQHGGKVVRQFAKYVEKHYGNELASARDYVSTYIDQAVQLMRSTLLLMWEQIQPWLEAAWELSKPHIRNLGKILVDNGQVAWDWLNEKVPMYVDGFLDTMVGFVTAIKNIW